MLPLLHLMTFDTILKSTYEHLVTKNTFTMFFDFLRVLIHIWIKGEVGAVKPV